VSVTHARNTQSRSIFTVDNSEEKICKNMPRKQERIIKIFRVETKGVNKCAEQI
jgi:hypothetical protein